MTEINIERELIIKEIMEPIGLNSDCLEEDLQGETIYNGILNLYPVIAQKGKPKIPNTQQQLRTSVMFQIWICEGCIEIEISGDHIMSFGYWEFDLSDPNCIKKVQETIRKMCDGKTQD